MELSTDLCRFTERGQAVQHVKLELKHLNVKSQAREEKVVILIKSGT